MACRTLTARLAMCQLQYSCMCPCLHSYRLQCYLSTSGLCCNCCTCCFAGDEHGKLLWPQGQWQVPAELPPLGAKLLLQPGHCDPTVNLYDCIVAFRKQHGVVGVWPVARGPGS
jgi:D-serine deaminase-like pyridoxal phosphate-dependent protein